MNRPSLSELSLPPAPTIPAVYACLLFDYLRALGVDPGSVLHPSQVLELEVHETHAPTPRDEWLGMLAQVAGRHDDPDLVLKIGAAFEVRHLGLAGYVLLSCATLGEVGEQMGRYYRLMGDVGSSRIHVEGEWAEDVFEWPEQGAPPPALEQLWAAATVTLGRWLTDRTDLRWDAHFRLPRPANRQLYERLFGGRIRFGCPQTKLVFPAQVLGLPIARANPELRERAEATALQEIRAQESEPEIVRRTRLLIGQHLASGRASLDSLAPLLGLSGRTLHRRLDECGCGFRELLDDVRRSRAERFLRHPSLPLAEIAFMLGYAEQSSFQHAFRRWTGLTPGEFRARASSAL